MIESKPVGYRVIYFDAVKAGIAVGEFIWLDKLALKVTNVTTKYVRGRVAPDHKEDRYETTS